MHIDTLLSFVGLVGQRYRSLMMDRHIATDIVLSVGRRRKGEERMRRRKGGSLSIG